ncbi:MAG TPA: hypothetical protein VFU47_16380 [Armatimonadota bacterium]|nr:hypothetical protein [Armatimonadota bacterium]
MAQLTLELEPIEERGRDAGLCGSCAAGDGDGPGSIQERFERFDRTHPEVYALLLRFARQVRERGWSRYSIRTLWELIRWHYSLSGPEDGFKLNDQYTSRYARKLLTEHPDEFPSGFFELREIRTR